MSLVLSTAERAAYAAALLAASPKGPCAVIAAVTREVNDPPAAAPFMTTWNGQRDPIKIELAPVAAILGLAELPNTPTQDGLVTVASATWGQFLGCIPADHFDEVCQLAGQGAGLGNGFDCLLFWRDLEQFLASQNL